MRPYEDEETVGKRQYRKKEHRKDIGAIMSHYL
jgi:hypothetical protein